MAGSLLRAVASGVATQTEMAGRLGRSRESLTHPLTTLIRAGFVVRDEDVLTGGRPEHRLADPIIRFLRLIVDPARPLLDERRWNDVWQRAAHQLDANIYGPHLEQIARRWAMLGHQPSDGGLITLVGGTKIADRANRRSMQLDVVACDDGADGRPAIRLIGEVKWSPDAFGPQAVDRLVQARQLLGAAGHDVDRCELALISRHPPRAARPAVTIGLDELYAV